MRGEQAHPATPAPAGLPVCGLVCLVCSSRQHPQALPGDGFYLAVTQLSHGRGSGVPHWSVQDMCAFCRQQRSQSRGPLGPLGVTPPRAVKIEVTSGPWSVTPRWMSLGWERWAVSPLQLAVTKLQGPGRGCSPPEAKAPLSAWSGMRPRVSGARGLLGEDLVGGSASVLPALTEP